jgi:hypothetical protein
VGVGVFVGRGWKAVAEDEGVKEGPGVPVGVEIAAAAGRFFTNKRYQRKDPPTTAARIIITRQEIRTGELFEEV